MALSQGVEPERLVFASYVPVEQHLGRLRCADLFLDSFPYNAHTTASDAIRMDLPLLTRQGESFASRVASSLLKSVSMDCLITSSAQAYEEEAIRLGCDRQALAALKAQLINHKAQSTLFDAQRYTQDLEKLYIDLIKTD
jgi:protein O-GlcNAc transferase